MWRLPSALYTHQVPQSADAKQFSQTMKEYWATFISTGLPSSRTSGVTWPAYVNDTELTLQLDSSSAPMSLLKAKECAWFSDYIVAQVQMQ